MHYRRMSFAICQKYNIMYIDHRRNYSTRSRHKKSKDTSSGVLHACIHATLVFATLSLCFPRSLAARTVLHLALLFCLRYLVFALLPRIGFDRFLALLQRG